MNAFSKIFNKKASKTSPIEQCILFQWAENEYIAEQAAAELEALRQERDALKEALQEFAVEQPIGVHSVWTDAFRNAVNVIEKYKVTK